MSTLPRVTDKLLYTPGPLTTSNTVKQALMHDFGSRDAAFMATIRKIRCSLLEVAGVAETLALYGPHGEAGH